MISITLICVGKLKERFYTDACGEYIKRLGAYCKIEIIELGENTPTSPKIPKGAFVIAMCVEGRKLSSADFAERLQAIALSGASRICFLIGGSQGLTDEDKAASDMRLSVSDMTFPHHLFRVMLLEQIYRAFKIAGGEKYHK